MIEQATKVYLNMRWSGDNCPQCKGELWHGPNGHLACYNGLNGYWCGWWGWPAINRGGGEHE